MLRLPDPADSVGLQAAISGGQRKAKIERGCADHAVWHIGNDASREASQSDSNVSAEGNHTE